MEVETGWLEMQSDGCLSGVLRTLTLNVQLELRRAAGDERPTTYAVHVAGGWLMGEAKVDRETGTITIVINSPELPYAMTLSAKPHSNTGQWRMSWSAPETGFRLTA